MGKQRGISLVRTIVWLAVLAFLGITAAKLMPSYLDYFAVKKMFASMEQNGETKGSVTDIRNSFDRRNAIESVQGVNGADLEIGKEGGETVITATWSKKIPVFQNLSACLDFVVTTAK
jgi:hypothetical protein